MRAMILKKAVCTPLPSVVGLGIPWTWYRSISGLWPEMGTKMVNKRILASPGKWGKHGLENGKNGPRFHFRTIFGPFFPFFGPFSPISQARPKSVFWPFSSRNGSLRAQRLKKFKILKFSSELEIFKRATHQTPIFCGEFWRSGLKISSEIEIFKRD